MKLLLRTFTLSLLGSCLCLYCQAQNLQLDLVVPPRDEPWARIHRMVQDVQGFLWLATDGGLFKYDGYKCTRYHHTPNLANSLANDWVESIAVGEENVLFLGTYGSGLDLFDLSNGNFTHYRHNPRDASTLSNDTVTAIVKDPQGMLWIGTHNGLNRFDPKSGKFTRFKNDPKNTSTLSDNQIRVLFVDQKGVLWVGTQSPWKNDGGGRIGGLNRFDSQTGKFTRYMHDPANPQSLVDNQVTAIFEDSRGTFWVGTAGDGLHTMNREKGTFERHSYDAAHPGKLSRPPVHNVNTSAVTDFITFISEDNKGRIWVGTLNGGINIFDHTAQKVVALGSEGANNVEINDSRFGTAYRTKDGIFWIASLSGNLYKLNPYKVAIPYNHLGKVVSDFQEDSAGVLWIATDQGVLQKKKNGEIQQFLIHKGDFSVNNVITDLESENQRNLSVGTLGGLYRFDKTTETFTKYYQEPSSETILLNDTITSLSKVKDSALWIGTSSGLGRMDLLSWKFKHYRPNPDDPTSLGSVFLSNEGATTVWSTAIDKGNSLWICVGGGINRFDEQKSSFRKYTIADVVINCLKTDKSGRIWAGTNAGLYQYDTKLDKFINFSDLLNIINRKTNVVSIAEDRQQYVWLKTANGLIKLNAERKEASFYETVGQGFGWFSRKIYATPNGEILSGDPGGYFAFHPDTLLGNLPSPRIFITGFTLLDEAMDSERNGLSYKPTHEAKQIRLQHNQNAFSFEFTCIDFTGSNEERTFLFRLDTYDKNWHRVTAEQSANYYNVPPGTYTFRVKAKNANGLWTEKSILVNISPPWWTTWWAYCLYGILSFAATYGLYFIQKQKVVEAERRRTRDRELAQAKEIQKAYKELKATQAQLVQREKMASLGELTAGIAHEIQNPLNFVNNFSEVNRELVTELKDEIRKGNVAEVESIANSIEENEQKILYHGKRADAIVKSMLQHSGTSKGKKEVVDLNALVEECLRLSYHGWRAKNKEFNVTIMTNFDDRIQQTSVVPQDMSRVILNLLANAFYEVHQKKMQQNGTYEPCVSVYTKALNGRVEIEVKDNGTGIPQNIIDKIFQPFFTTKPTGRGTGLGLSLSYDIIKAHDGELKVSSRTGEGSSFVIQLNIHNEL
ncbi:hypothetical protein HRH25_23520 [Flavisolibacter sp. BT320]|nr:hypothetical protein [Flavisolibacter longurius]